MDDIVLDETIDEHGEKRWGWWCDKCETGNFLEGPEERQEEADEHHRNHRS